MDVKSHGSTVDVHPRLRRSSLGEEGGMLGVEVKFVDIKQNTCGEGGLLDDD